MKRWKGPCGDTDIPAGQRFEGWSEFTNAAGAPKARYGDGDSMSAHHWREVTANVNRQIAMSQQPLWQTGFVGTSVTSSGGARQNIGTAWDIASWYACQMRVRLLQSPRKGAETPPRLLCRVRARMVLVGEGGGDSPEGFVRIMSTRREADAAQDGYANMVANSPASSYAMFTITSTSFPGSPGWSEWKEITLPRVEYKTEADPLGLLPDVEFWQTHLVLAAHGWTDTADYSCNVAAVEVFEELRGGTAGTLTGGID